jgi:hypothetical protein
MSPISIALEIMLAVLLIACLFYCWRLERKLNALRTGEQGMRAAAAELNRAVVQAEMAIKALKAATPDATGETARDVARDIARDAGRGPSPARTDALRRRAL